MKSPNKIMGGIAGAVGQAMGQQTGAMGQQTGTMTGALGGTTNLEVQPQLGQMQQNPYPNQNALGPAQAAKIPGMFPGSAFNQGQKTYGILSAPTSKEAAASEARRLAAQKKAREERDAKKENKKKIDPVSGKTMTVSAPKRTYSESSSKIIYNEDGSVSKKQTLK